MKRAALGLVMLAGACGKDPAPSAAAPRPTEEDAVTSKDSTTELTIAQQWDGPIRLDGETADTAFAVRDDAAYDALIARLPATRVQMKQPAPPSDDPLLARPAIDFATHMLLVVVRPAGLERPELVHAGAAGGRVVVHARIPAPTAAAQPRGVGAYAAAKVPRADGDVVLAVPPVITEEQALAAAAGELVTVRGELTRTRIPTILGVDVDEGSATAGELAEATGWLEITTVTQAEIDEQIARSGQFAHRGPGTFHRLVAPGRAGLAAARPVP